MRRSGTCGADANEKKRAVFSAGGCFVKSADARSLGYTVEADLAAWPASLARLRSRYPQARVIVPGHGDPGGWELIENTLRLVEKNPAAFGGGLTR